LNGSAETAPFVAEAFEMVGAPKTADICRRAIALAFPGGLPEIQEIQSAASKYPEEVLDGLEPLDEEFFAYPHSH